MTTKIRFALVWAGALLVVLCFDGRLAGETPTAEKPVPPAAGGGEAWLDSILSAAWRGQPCVDPDDPSTSLDCFQLWNACRPLYLIVEFLPEDAEEIGLTEERIQTAAESRLRAARLYDAEAADHFLYVNVNVVERAFSIDVGYRKLLHDEALDIGGMAETWNTGAAGMHGGSGASFILQGVSEHMDLFVVEYLRVNEPACGGP